MSLDFDGSNDSVTNDAFTLSGYPITLFCRFYPDAITNHDAIMFIGDASTDLNYFTVAVQTNANKKINLEIRDTSSTNVYSTEDVVVGAWNTVYVCFQSTTVQKIVINNGTPFTGGSTRAPVLANIDRVAVGRQMRSTPRGPFNGRIADFAVWSVELTANEIASLDAGMSPSIVRPDALLVHWPLFGSLSAEPDWSPRQLVGTINGPVRIDHPPQIWVPSKTRRVIREAAAAGVVTADMWMPASNNPYIERPEVVAY